MSNFPGSPRPIRGRLVPIDPTTGAVLRIIASQYNLDTLTRSLQIKGVTGESGESGDHMEALRLRSHGEAGSRSPRGKFLRFR